jgi:hypothetical protein
MTVGRFLTFAVILVISAVASTTLVRRDRERHPPKSAAISPPARRMPARAAAHEAAVSLTSAPSSAPSVSDAPEDNPLSEALCPSDMVLADGMMCAEPQRQCASREGAGSLCQRYEPAHCRPGLSLRFCIDRYEFPNQEGALPAVMVTFAEARSACEEEGKRLCRDLEWTFACEGPSGFALPYGDELVADACNVGQSGPSVHAEELWEARNVSSVVARVDARTRSGSLARCVSPVGAFDMTGNVEEWVVGSDSSATLRGGQYAAPEPTCRSERTTTQPAYRMFHTGFRCCRDPFTNLPGHSALVSEGAASPVAPTPGFD